MTVPPVPDLEGLLAEDRWMRRLALRLAGEPQAAEDLAQEAWVAALGGGGARKLRPWLGGVVRNLWLDLRRVKAQRRKREERAARGEHLPSADELASELELRQRVATALFELEEPYRRTLTLRFYHGHTLAEIARAEGASLTVIHERVQRGLARLRARLVRTSRDERDSWAVALLALARPSTGVGAGLEAIAMASAWKLGMAAAVLVGGGLAWWWRGDTRVESAAVVARAAEPAAQLARLEPVEVKSPGVPERESLPAEVPPPAPAAAEAPERVVRGRVVDAAGAPLANATLTWTNDHETTTKSDASGRFELAWPRDFESLAALEGSTAHGILCADSERVTLRVGQVGQGEEALVIVAPLSASAGVVVDPDGLPIEGATLSVRVRDAVFRELGVARPMGELFTTAAGKRAEYSVRTDARGEFELEGIPGGAGLYLLVEAAGYEPSGGDLPEVADLARVFTLEPGAAAQELTGTVLDPTGMPVADARVSIGRTLVFTEADGRFRLPLDGDPRFQGADGSWLANGDASGGEIVAVHAGFQPARAPLAGHPPSLPFELVLGPPPLAIRGRVVDTRGAPRAGILVWVRDPTPFGSEVQQISEGTTAAFSVTVEDLLRGGLARQAVRTDADGEFELGGLLARAYALRVFDPSSAERAGPFEVEAGREGVELLLAGAECVRVAGRVVSLTGKPLSGVEIRLRAERGETMHDTPPGQGDPLVTDAEGRFAFERVALAGTQLQLEHPQLLFRTVELAGRGDLEQLELVEPVLCELQVDLTRDSALANRLEVLDGDGEPLELLESFGAGIMAGKDALFRDGLSEVLRVKESAATLVLRKNGLEVLRRPLKLDPNERTVLRP